MRRRRFQFQVPEEAKTLHFVRVLFQPDERTGEISAPITVHTDLDGGKPVTVTATVSVRQSPVAVRGS